MTKHMVRRRRSFERRREDVIKRCAGLIERHSDWMMLLAAIQKRVSELPPDYQNSHVLGRLSQLEYAAREGDWRQR